MAERVSLIEQKTLQKMTVTKLKKNATGIQGFDDLLYGGLISGRGILVLGGPGTGKTILLSEFLYRGITEFHQNGVFVTFEERPQYIIDNLQTFEWDFQKFVANQKLQFVDLSPTNSCEEVSDCYDLEPILERIKYAIKKVNARRVVIDGLGNLFAKFSNKKMVREVLYNIFDELKKLGICYMISSEKLDVDFSVEEYIADGVVEVSVDQNQNQIVRNLRIIKIRGTSYRPEKCVFEITTEGIKLYPRPYLDGQHYKKRETQKLKFGISWLDEAIGGGLNPGNVIVVVGDPGTGKTTLGMHFLYEGLKNKQNALYISFKDSAEGIRIAGANYGWNFKYYEKENRLHFINDPSHPDKLIHTIINTIIKHDIKRVVVDSIAFIDPTTAYPEKVTQFFITLIRWLKINNVSCVMNYLTVDNEFVEKGSLFTALETPLRRVLNAVPDGIIILNYAMNNRDIIKQLNILKLRGANHDKAFFNYEINHKGLVLKEDSKQLTRKEENNNMRAA